MDTHMASLVDPLVHQRERNGLVGQVAASSGRLRGKSSSARTGSFSPKGPSKVTDGPFWHTAHSAILAPKGMTPL